MGSSRFATPAKDMVAVATGYGPDGVEPEDAVTLCETVRGSPFCCRVGFVCSTGPN